MSKNIAIILASGTGKRMEMSTPKQFAKIKNKMVIEYTLNAFEFHPLIDEIILVCSVNYIEACKKISSNYKKVKQVVSGGATRQESSYNGVFAIKEDRGKVLIHDACRPLVTEKIITNCIMALDSSEAVCTAINSSDTLFEVDENGTVISIPNRKFFKRAQTPQGFNLSVIKKAHLLAKAQNVSVTDDCSLIKHFNLCKIGVVLGDEKNIKITYPIDIETAEKFL